MADISIKEIKRNILEVYKEYFQRKEKGGGLLVASNDRSSYTAEELKTYQHTDVQTWIMQHMHLEQDEWKFNENINEKEDDHVLYYLIQNGIIIENFLWKLLQDREELEKQKIAVNVRGEKENKRVVFWKFERNYQLGKNITHSENFICVHGAIYKAAFSQNIQKNFPFWR